MNMNPGFLRRYLVHLCVCVLACAYSALSVAAEENPNARLYSALKGRWEGTLAGDFRSQEVSWHFEVDDTGALKGFMGPSLAGMPRTPMENLSVSATTLSFDIAGQHASFASSITPDGISGTWQQGSALPLQMKKRNFVFELSDFARSSLLGSWDLADREAGGGVGINISFGGIKIVPVPGAAIHFEFKETEDGGLSGTLSIPGSDLQDVPLVDIYVTDEGFAQFATDNGRSFSGKLINGVLVGDFATVGRRTATRSFVRASRRESGFYLDVSDAAWQRMTGRWYYEVFGDDVVLEFTTTDDNQKQGLLVFSEGPLGSDPLLELIVAGDDVRFTTLTGRTFAGTFDGADIVGEYRVNTYPRRVTFTRTPD
jgi:hypothetical protein